MKKVTISESGSGLEQKKTWIRIRFVLRGWIRIWSMSDQIQNPSMLKNTEVIDHIRNLFPNLFFSKLSFLILNYRKYRICSFLHFEILFISR